MKKEKTEGWTVFRQQARERIRAFGPAALRWLRDSFSMEPGRVAGLSAAQQEEGQWVTFRLP